MSFIKLTEQFFEKVTLDLHPRQKFTSSSSGITGSVRVGGVYSKCIKDVIDKPILGQNSYFNKKTNSGFNSSDYSAITALRNANLIAGTAFRNNTSANILGQMELYMTGVQKKIPSIRNRKVIDVFRFEPPFVYNKNVLRKN